MNLIYTRNQWDKKTALLQFKRLPIGGLFFYLFIRNKQSLKCQNKNIGLFQKKGLCQI